MKKALLALLLIYLQFSFFNHTKAQDRFDASVFGGFDMCQIDGDATGHYNHLGLRGGVGTSFALGSDQNSPLHMVVELAFAQKGAHMESAGFTRDVSLNYVQLPLMASYTIANDRLRLAAGVAPAVQVGVKVTDNGAENSLQEDNYKRFDALPVVAAARYMFSDHIGIEVRFETSMLSITKQNSSGTYRLFRDNKGAFNRVITIGLAYQFLSL